MGHVTEEMTVKLFSNQNSIHVGGSIALTVPLILTGIKAGVRFSPCAVAQNQIMLLTFLLVLIVKR